MSLEKVWELFINTCKKFSFRIDAVSNEIKFHTVISNKLIKLEKRI